MTAVKDQFLWVEKYRPQTIKECILPEALKKTFQGIVKQGDLINMTLSGSSGTGKTSVAQALALEMGADFLKINASSDGNIDTLRVKIAQYASTISLTGGRKIILLDEADGMNPNSLQPALRSAIEEFAGNAGFILTCNKKNKIIPALQDRCPVIDFKFPKSERPALAMKFLTRLKMILKAEKVTCDSDDILVQLITKNFPSFRKTIGELQRYVIQTNGKIDTGIFAQIGEINVTELVKSLKAKDFIKVRSWVVQNLDNDSAQVFRSIYDAMFDHFVPKSIPEAILILAEYQYKAAFVVDQEINLAATLIQLMAECEFK